MRIYPGTVFLWNGAALLLSSESRTQCYITSKGKGLTGVGLIFHLTVLLKPPKVWLFLQKFAVLIVETKKPCFHLQPNQPPPTNLSLYLLFLNLIFSKDVFFSIKLDFWAKRNDCDPFQLLPPFSFLIHFPLSPPSPLFSMPCTVSSSWALPMSRLIQFHQHPISWIKSRLRVNSWCDQNIFHSWANVQWLCNVRSNSPDKWGVST